MFWCSLNSFFMFLGYGELRYKLLRMQKRVFRDGSRELTVGDYRKLLRAAGAGSRTGLLLRVLAGTGIRVSELKYVTVEAVRAGMACVNLKGRYRTIFVPNTLRRRYDLIALEDLTVRNLMRNHKLAGGIQDVSWSAFRRMLEYKSVWYGKQVIIIPRFFPSSQICSQCGFRWLGIKDLSVRDWTCPVCNTIHDRDVNAARNILAKGLGLAVS